MKKIISSVLTATMITAMFATVAVPASATDGDKATIKVYDFVGGAYKDGVSTQSQLEGKAVERETYTFEVGDLVNVTTSCSVSSAKALSGFLSATFINQVSADPTSESAFLQRTDSLVSALQFDDRYFAEETGEDGTFSNNETASAGTMYMTRPELVYTDVTNPDYNEDDLKADFLFANGINGSTRGIKLNATPKKVSTFTVLVTDTKETYLYSVAKELIDVDLEDVTADVDITTTLEKVGHIDIEKPTEPPTQAPTSAPTQAPTPAPTQAPTPAPTEAPTQAPTPAPTEAPTEAPTDEPIVVHTYTLAGTSNLLGSNWDPADTNNDMVQLGDSSLYQSTYAGVSSGSVEFKVVQDHSWDVSYGVPGKPSYDNNYKFDVEYDNATVTIRFDASTGEAEWSVSYVEIPTEEPTAEPTEAPTEAPTEEPTAEPTEEPTAEPTEAPTEEPTSAPIEEHTYFAVGSAALFNPAWDPAVFEMSVNASTGLYEVTVPVTEEQWDSDFEYKVARDGNWDVSYNDEGLATGEATNAIGYIEEGATAVVITWNPDTECAGYYCVMPETHTYFAVGSAALFNPAWDPAVFEMSVNASTGLYEVTIPVTEDQWDSDFEYKVARDGNWEVSYNDEGLATGEATNAIGYVEPNATAVVITWNSETECAGFYCVVEGEDPTEEPTAEPTEAPTKEPTAEPTDAPTEEPTEAPTEEPTAEPTDAPTNEPTEVPTQVVTSNPTSATNATGTTPTGTTSAPTSTSSNNSSSNTTSSNTSSTTGKVATGDSTTVTLVLIALMVAGGCVVSLRKKFSL